MEDTIDREANSGIEQVDAEAVGVEARDVDVLQGFQDILVRGHNWSQSKSEKKQIMYT